MINNIQKVKDNSVIINIFKGVITSFVITLILIILLSFILVKTNISENIIIPGIYVITSISIFIGTMSAIRNNGLVFGSIIGGIYILLLYLLSSILNGEFGISANTVILIALSLITGALGGIAGTNIKRA